VIGTLRAVTLAGATALIATTAACGGSSGDGGKNPDKDAKVGGGAAAYVSTCTDQATPAARPYPAAFPSDWPFPSRTVVFNAEDRGSDGTIVTAVSATRFKEILRFMNHDVVDAGYKVKEGETEEHDAEAEWEGNGYRGRWAIRESSSCRGETVIQVLSAKG